MLFPTMDTPVGGGGVVQNTSASSSAGCCTGLPIQDTRKRRTNRQDAKEQAIGLQKCSTWLCCWSISTTTSAISSLKTLMASVRDSFRPPHTLAERLVQMIIGIGDTDTRAMTVCDPCVGTGRLLLHASNYSLRLYGQDIDPTLCLATLVNGFLFAPWAGAAASLPQWRPVSAST